MTASEPGSPSSPKVAAIIYNPIKIDLDEVRREVARAESEAGYGPSLWLETTKEDVGQGAARSALEDGAGLVISAGGDGTVRAVAEVIAGTSATFAILPAGTGNLLEERFQQCRHIAQPERIDDDQMPGPKNFVLTGSDPVRHGLRLPLVP